MTLRTSARKDAPSGYTLPSGYTSSCLCAVCRLFRTHYVRSLRDADCSGTASSLEKGELGGWKGQEGWTDDDPSQIGSCGCPDPKPSRRRDERHRRRRGDGLQTLFEVRRCICRFCGFREWMAPVVAPWRPARYFRQHFRSLCGTAVRAARLRRSFFAQLGSVHGGCSFHVLLAGHRGCCGSHWHADIA
jgi:hypothetical protein